MFLAGHRNRWRGFHMGKDTPSRIRHFAYKLGHRLTVYLIPVRTGTPPSPTMFFVLNSGAAKRRAGNPSILAVPQWQLREAPESGTAIPPKEGFLANFRSGIPVLFPPVAGRERPPVPRSRG